MKSIIFCYAMVAGLFLPAFTVLGQEKAEAPAYTNGDSWQFRVVEKGMATDRLDTNFEVSFRGGRPIVRPPFAELRRMLAIEDDRQYLQFPLFVGKTWYVRYATGGTVYFRATTNVTGMEEVATPAGTFRAFMIERHERGIRMGGDAGRGEGRLAGRLLYTYYYSPSTQSIVKHSLLTGQRGTREIELISFKANRSFKNSN